MPKSAQLSQLDIDTAIFERGFGGSLLECSPRYQQRERLKNRRAFKHDWQVVKHDKNATPTVHRMFRRLIAQTYASRPSATP